MPTFSTAELSSALLERIHRARSADDADPSASRRGNNANIFRINTVDFDASCAGEVTVKCFF
jgi:hypothetical protein